MTWSTGPRICDECGKTFANGRILTVHKAAYHKPWTGIFKARMAGKAKWRRIRRPTA